VPGSGEVRSFVRAAVGELAPDELARFDEVWQAYLDDPRSPARVLKSGSAPLGSGIDIASTAVSPLVLAITGETLAGLVREPAAGAARKFAVRMLPARRKREKRRAALTGPPPDPAVLEHTVMRAMFLDVARKAGSPDDTAAKIADTLVSIFTTPGPGPRP
jgi:hypothetical protein